MLCKQWLSISIHVLFEHSFPYTIIPLHAIEKRHGVCVCGVHQQVTVQCLHQQDLIVQQNLGREQFQERRVMFKCQGSVSLRFLYIILVYLHCSATHSCECTVRACKRQHSAAGYAYQKDICKLEQPYGDRAAPSCISGRTCGSTSKPLLQHAGVQSSKRQPSRIFAHKSSPLAVELLRMIFL
jgi:hypothetical protein